MKYVALLRGINVGNHNRIKMQELKDILETLNLENIQVYGQSGNIAFETQQIDRSNLAKEMSAKINSSHGFKPFVLIVKSTEIKHALKQNPFDGSQLEPKSVHFGFLSQKPKSLDLDKLQELKKDNEQFELKDKIFYLYAPDGVHKSKLATASEKALGVDLTDRNLRTVKKMLN